VQGQPEDNLPLKPVRAARAEADDSRRIHASACEMHVLRPTIDRLATIAGTRALCVEL